MSVVEAKNVMFVGESNAQISSLKESLKNECAVITCTSCLEGLNSLNLFKNIDLVIINQQHNDPNCSALLFGLQNSNETIHMPVLTYVDNIEARINQALMRGAADYFTPTEDLDSVLQKVKSNFGQASTYTGVPSVDISEAKTASTLNETKVYVVEDDPLLRTLLTTKFDIANVTHDFSADGLNVENNLRNFKPSVILLDIMIGGVNGLDVLESIKHTDDLKNIPVVVFSNQDSYEERQRATTLGANNYLVKATTDLSDLVKLLSSFSKA